MPKAKKKKKTQKVKMPPKGMPPPGMPKRMMVAISGGKKMY